MTAKTISIVGRSGAGKTALIEKLIPALAARGVRTGTVKRDAHRFEIDYPGKDTYRHFAAGARSVLIASAQKIALVKRVDGPLDLDDLCARYMDDVDLIITEGYKSGDKPKIEVMMRETREPPLCGPGDNLAAAVSDDPLDLGCPCFGWDEIETLADFIAARFVD